MHPLKYCPQFGGNVTVHLVILYKGGRSEGISLPSSRRPSLFPVFPSSLACPRVPVLSPLPPSTRPPSHPPWEEDRGREPF